MNYQTILRICLLMVPFCNSFCLSASTNVNQHKWQTEFTRVSIDIDPGVGLVKGDVTLKLVNSNLIKGDIFLILNRELKVHSVKDGNNELLVFIRDSSSLIVRIPEYFFKQDTIDLNVNYEGSFTNRVPELNYMKAYVGTEISYALNTSYWYPVVAGTNYRSRGAITFYTPIDWSVASSGMLTEETQVNNRRISFFEINSPSKFSFAASSFINLRKTVDGLDVGVFLLGGDLNKAKFYLENCAPIVGFLKEYYGIFPYEGYLVVEIPTYLLGNVGGGGYDGLTFFMPGAFSDEVFFIPTFGHEIGHLWWGSYISSPEGPVINEGLAQMSMGLYLEHTVGEKVFRSLLKDGALEIQMWQTARLYFQFISPADSSKFLLPGILHGADSEIGIFQLDKRQSLHSLANSKGFFIYFMLRDLIGPEAFREGLRSTIRGFAWRSDLTLMDLCHEFERASGKNLKWFFHQWFYRKGAPEFTVTYNIKSREKGFQIVGIINQIRDVYRVNAEIEFVKGDIHEKRYVEIRNRKTPFSIVLPYKPDTVLFDPDYKILRWTDEY